ncbi:MAG: 8-amino-7-oxononanoate synthase [Planctomycetota bacterium]
MDQARNKLNRRLTEYITSLEDQQMNRHLRRLSSEGKYVFSEGRRFLNLAGNDYLALASHPAVKAASTHAVELYGTGSGASRLVSGHLDIHEQTENAFASFKEAESALLFPTGYTANLAVLTTLPQPGDLICQDKLNHASLIDAASFSPAEVRTYPHATRDKGYAHSKLERLLRNHATSHPAAGRWIVTDSVFSMDGDVADLPGLCKLAENYDAILVVDEAHATGVLGPKGTGLAELQGVSHKIPITISTASKALGGLGGIVTADRVVIESLVNRARPFIYSTAVPPAQAAAIKAAVEVVRNQPERREHLAELSGHLRRQLSKKGWLGLDQSVATPIIPLLTGSVKKALSLAKELRNKDFYTVAIRPPTVASGSSRVRLSLRSDFDFDELDVLVKAIGSP